MLAGPVGLHFPAKDVSKMIPQTHDIQPVLASSNIKAAKCKHMVQLSPIAPPALFRDAPYNLQVCVKQTFSDYL